VSALFHGVLFSWFRSQNYILQPSYFQGAGQMNADPNYDQNQMQAVMQKLDELINALRR
jgi:hypothetical protein